MATTLASLSSEVLLQILGTLDDAGDLARVRQVNRRLHAIGGDALLWRNLFVCTYLLPHSSLTTLDEKSRAGKRRRLSNRDDVDPQSSPARVIKGIPLRRRIASNFKLSSEEEEDRRIDWYALFKISRNWQTGNFTSRQLQTLKEQAREPLNAVPGPSRLPQESNVLPQKRSAPHRTIIDSTQSHIFTSSEANEGEDGVPVILVFPSSSQLDSASNGEAKQESLARYQSSHLGRKRLQSVCITSLALSKTDAVGDSVRLFVGYSSGDSSMLSFNTMTNTFHDEVFIDSPSSEAIVSAVLHSPLLVTCTVTFKIRIYRLTNTSVRLMEERRSYSCHWPAMLRLEPLQIERGKEQHFRLSIAYSSPVYPIGWTVGLQEIIIGAQKCLSSRSASARQSHIVTRIDSPSKEVRTKRMLGAITSDEERRNQVGRLTSLSYEDPFIVVGTKDNDVVCFKVTGTSRSVYASSTLPSLSISHVHAFQGHTGTVHSVSLNEGRCVTGGSDGSVRIWKLGDEEEALAKAAGLITTIDASLRRGLGKVITIGSSSSSHKRKRAEEMITSSVPLTLADILRDSQSGTTGVANRSSSSSAVVRWVTSAFDRIISVSAIKNGSTHRSTVSNCRSEAALVEREEEQVQIWNFSQ